MNIGLLISSFPPDVCNGAELQLKQLAFELAQRGHGVTVYTRRFCGKPLVEHRDGYQIRRRRVLPLSALRMIWDTLVTVRDVAASKPRPDVLLCYQTVNSGLIGVLAQSLLGIPAIVSIRGSREYRLSLYWANRLVVPFVYRRARRMVVQTRCMLQDLGAQLAGAGKADLVASIKSKVSIIPNGINLPHRDRSTGTKIMYVGRLIRNKGVSDLLQAMQQIPEAEAVIVGEGPERKNLAALADGLRVTFLGSVPPNEVTNHLRQARMLVHPSHLGDGLPNSILEAMSCGVPVIATRTSGMPDVVQHDATGFLFEPGDVEQLSRYIELLRTDDEMWRRMGVRSLEVVQQYSWENVVPQIEQLLSTTCSKRPQTKRFLPAESSKIAVGRGEFE